MSGGGISNSFKRIRTLTCRNLKEIMIDPLSLVFCLGIPVVMLIAMELIFSEISATGVEIFEIDKFAPGIAVFGYTFSMLYIALMIAGDKNSSFISRILVSPVKKAEYLLSYVFAGMLVMTTETLFYYVVAMFFGFSIFPGGLISVVYLLFSQLFYCSCGLFIGSVCRSEKQAGPVSSGIITGAGILGGVWMPVETMGKGFLSVCNALPFYNGVKIAQQAVAGNYSDVLIPIAIILAYTAVIFTIAVAIFKNTVGKN